jgi:branched-chain amino acid transport system ATP-binding protein
MVLEVDGLTMDFGGLRAVNSVSFGIDRNEIVALIGPNGAGKTTVFNCITGVYKPTAGSVRVAHDGGAARRVNGMKPNRITELGLARTFQNIRLFQNMSVLENVMLGRHCRLTSGVVGAVFRGGATRAEEERVVHESYEVLKEIGLERWVNELAKNLPYGAQRRLEIARALATDPFILLLDEPAAGMNPHETRSLNELIVQIRDSRNLSVLLIEHDMSLVMRLSERIYVMDYGKLIAEGSPAQIKADPVVIKAYLGEDADA